VSFSGTDVALRPPAVALEDPYDHMSLGRYVEVQPTTPNGTAALAVRYPEPAVRNGSVDESTVGLWRWAGGAWSPANGSRGDSEGNVAAGTVSSHVVVAPIGQRASFAVAALDAPDAAGTDGHVRVTATVRNPNVVADEQPVELRVDGRLLDVRRVRIPPNATATVSFALDASTLAPGDHVFAVQTRGDGAVASLAGRADGNRTAADDG
jgi:hypothetical protein